MKPRALIAYALVALAALLVRWPALRPNPTPDACEYQMLARSLARGEGYTLPVRVRHDATGPVVHDARAERAPALPVFLAACEVAGLDDGRGAISPGLQVCNALLGVACALLVAWLARGSVLAGLVAALAVPLVYSSVRVLAEPLGLVFLLLALRCDLVGSWRGAIGCGCLLALARLARPELAIAIVPIVGARFVRREHRIACTCTAAFVLVSLVAWAFGFGAPQGFLFRVGSFRDVMFAWGKAPPPAESSLAYVSSEPARVARLVGTNLVDLVAYAFRWGGALVLIPLLAKRREDRVVAAVALACALGAGLTWATRDHSRFLVAPLGMLAVLVPVAWERWASARARVVLVALLIGPTLVPQLRELRREARPNPVWAGDEVDAIAVVLRERLRDGEAFAAVSPWSLTLASGRPGLLLPNELEEGMLRELLRRHPEVRAVVLRPDAPHDALTPEPVQYERAIAPVASVVRVGSSSMFLLNGAR